MSIRQEKKAARAGQKDKNGVSLALSRPQRRGIQRLQRSTNGYEAYGGKNPESGQSYTKPGAQNHY